MNPIAEILAKTHCQPGMYSIIRTWPRIERLAIHLSRSSATDQYKRLEAQGIPVAQAWRGHDGKAYILRQYGRMGA